MPLNRENNQNMITHNMSLVQSELFDWTLSKPTNFIELKLHLKAKKFVFFGNYRLVA